MNERADSVNGLVEHQTMVRFSPKLAQQVHEAGAAMVIEWVDERHATVALGEGNYPGLLLDLPTVNELYVMASKSRLYKSGDMGQMLLVHDPDDPEDVEFFNSQRYDPIRWTLLSGVTPPSTYVWSRIFRKQNKPPKADFAKVERDLSDVNILAKEDVELEFIHPKELESLYVKPGQTLLVDGRELQAPEGVSVHDIIKREQEAALEEAKRLRAEAKQARKEAKKRRKLSRGSSSAALLSPGYSNDLSSSHDPSQQQQQQQQQQPQQTWQVAVDKSAKRQELETRIAELQTRLEQMQHRPDFTAEDREKLKIEISRAEAELAETLKH